MIRLFRVFLPTSVVTLGLSEVLLTFACLFLATYIVYPNDYEIFLLYDGGLVRIAIVVLLLVFGLYYQNMYSDFRMSKILLVQRFIFAVGLVLMFEAALGYISPDLILPNTLMLMGCGLCLVTLVSWRIAYRGGIFKALGTRRILFLGSNATARTAAEEISTSPQLGFVALGFVDDLEAAGSQVANTPVLAPVKQLSDVVDQQRPDLIIVGLTERRSNLPVMELLDLRFRGIRIQEAAALYEWIFGRVPISELRPSQLIYSAELGPQPSAMRNQQVYSFLIALIAAVIALPLMLIVAIAVKLTSPGPILFRQTRVGLNGAPFTLYKFRSMRVDAESGTGAVWAKRQDPRVTPIGKYLRSLRLDELPQLFNVLRREMSIVGPRPERPEFIELLSSKIPFYRHRHSVRPGITGWAQINYKYGETLEDTIVKLEYDLYYIKNLSTALDFYIMFHTLKVMLVSRTGQ